jgi:hypothetical protein
MSKSSKLHLTFCILVLIFQIGLSLLPKVQNWTFVNSTVISKDVMNVLTTILELGYIDVGEHLVVLPLSSIWTTDRISPFLQYMSDYVIQHPRHYFSCYFTLFDGWREHTEPKDHPRYLKLPLGVLYRDFVDHSSSITQHGRFISTVANNNILPILNESICSFGRHKGDT